jgi:hypothetical protein
MFLFVSFVALVAIMATPVNLLRRVWEASVAKYLVDAATSAQPGPKTDPTTSR